MVREVRKVGDHWLKAPEKLQPRCQVMAGGWRCLHPTLASWGGGLSAFLGLRAAQQRLSFRKGPLRAAACALHRTVLLIILVEESKCDF